MAKEGSTETLVQVDEDLWLPQAEADDLKRRLGRATEGARPWREVVADIDAGR